MVAAGNSAVNQVHLEELWFRFLLQVCFSFSRRQLALRYATDCIFQAWLD